MSWKAKFDLCYSLLMDRAPISRLLKCWFYKQHCHYRRNFLCVSHREDFAKLIHLFTYVTREERQQYENQRTEQIIAYWFKFKKLPKRYSRCAEERTLGSWLAKKLEREAKGLLLDYEQECLDKIYSCTK